jgi:hypothetical protein
MPSGIVASEGHGGLGGMVSGGWYMGGVYLGWLWLLDGHHIHLIILGVE